MTDLRAALLANQGDIKAALERAQEELTACRERCAELEDLIERAQSVLSLASPASLPIRRDLTLHDAMRTVLSANGGLMSAAELAAEVNRRGLYHRRDGRPVDPSQVHARVGAYATMFVRRDRRITLRDDATFLSRARRGVTGGG